LFEYPTLRSFATEVDRLQDPQGLRFDAAEEDDEPTQSEYYSNDRNLLTEQLPKTFPTGTVNEGKKTVFLTGATGFLGSHILSCLIRDTIHVSNIICHVRASDATTGLARLKNTLKAYGLMLPSERVSCVAGDLSLPHLGLSQSVWNHLSNTVDTIIHNGARVHWVLDYSTLRPANVLSTLELLQLSAMGKSKNMVFVSSTSVLDTDFYTSTEAWQRSVSQPVSEDDDLAGSAKGLATGYGQTKWVCEGLMRDAGARGLKGWILRPGYVTGESHRGTTITDDFLVRLLKGCVQLSYFPDLGKQNYINMMPVDGLSRICAAAAVHLPLTSSQDGNGGVKVLNAARRSLTFNTYFRSLAKYGYNVQRASYEGWRIMLQDYVNFTAEEGYEEHALLPLFHLAVSDLPADIRSPTLGDGNTRALLERVEEDGSDGEASFEVDEEMVGRYISYLCEVGFMPRPPKVGMKSLPVVQISDGQKEALKKVEGRGAVVS
jgi:L-aminoadipate-semialdehyde dehydrogenase